MAIIARFEAKMSTTKPLGITGPLDILQAVSANLDGGPMLVQVATGVTNQQIRIIGTQGITTVVGFLIATDQNITVVPNSGTQGIPVNANGFILVSSTSLTGIGITNASGNTANVTVWTVGN
jgi:hypothetical protein